MIRTVLVLALCAGCLTGCATAPKKDYTRFNEVDPHSLLIVPVVNRSLDVDAPDYFLSTITIPLAEQGYYVFPVNMVKRILEDEGLSDSDMVYAAPPQKLSQLFGADAVLYLTINRWDAKYIVLNTVLTVDITYEIRDGKSGDKLWMDSRLVQYSPSNNSSGNILADLVAMAVTAAITKAAPNYMPLAHQANAIAFTYPGAGIPPGKYLREAKSEDKVKAGDENVPLSDREL